MPLALLGIGMIAVIALLIAPLGAFCPAVRAVEAGAAAHASATHLCSDDNPTPATVTVSHCALLCGFFTPSVEVAALDFEPSIFDALVSTLEGLKHEPPAPPPRA